MCGPGWFVAGGGSDDGNGAVNVTPHSGHLTAVPSNSVGIRTLRLHDGQKIISSGINPQLAMARNPVSWRNRVSESAQDGEAQRSAASCARTSHAASAPCSAT